MTDTSDFRAIRAGLLRAIDFPGGGSTANTWGLFHDGDLLQRLVRLLAARGLETFNPTVVVGIESAGFALASALALTLGTGFVPVRHGRQCRLAGTVLEVETDPDYLGRTQVLRLQSSACGAGDRVLLIDDWAETGNHLLGARQLLIRAGVSAVACCAIVDELPDAVRECLEPYSFLITADELDAVQR